MQMRVHPGFPEGQRHGRINPALHFEGVMAGSSRPIFLKEERTMSQWLELTAADGFRLSAYRAGPPGKARGALVVVQESLRGKDHIRSRCDGLASDSHLPNAPALL